MLDLSIIDKEFFVINFFLAVLFFIRTTFHGIDFWKVKVFHNVPKSFLQKILILSEVIDPWQIKKFDLQHIFMTFSELYKKNEFWEKCQSIICLP